MRTPLRPVARGSNYTIPHLDVTSTCTVRLPYRWLETYLQHAVSVDLGLLSLPGELDCRVLVTVCKLLLSVG